MSILDLKIGKRNENVRRLSRADISPIRGKALALIALVLSLAFIAFVATIKLMKDSKILQSRKIDLRGSYRSDRTSFEW